MHLSVEVAELVTVPFSVVGSDNFRSELVFEISQLPVVFAHFTLLYHRIAAFPVP